METRNIAEVTIVRKSPPRFLVYNLFEIKQQHPSHDLYQWQSQLRSTLDASPQDTKIMWFADEQGGAGKTWFAKTMLFQRPKTQVVGVARVGCLRRLVDPTTTLFIFDIPRGDTFDVAAIEMVKNGVVVDRTGCVVFSIPQVVVFAGSKPSERIDVIKLCGGGVQPVMVVQPSTMWQSQLCTTLETVPPQDTKIMWFIVRPWDTTATWFANKMLIERPYTQVLCMMQPTQLRGAVDVLTTLFIFDTPQMLGCAAAIEMVKNGMIFDRFGCIVFPIPHVVVFSARPPCQKALSLGRVVVTTLA